MSVVTGDRDSLTLPPTPGRRVPRRNISGGGVPWRLVQDWDTGNTSRGRIRELMADQVTRGAMVDRGTQEAMAGPPPGPRPQPRPGLYDRSPTTPPKKILGESRGPQGPPWA